MLRKSDIARLASLAILLAGSVGSGAAAQSERVVLTPPPGVAPIPAPTPLAEPRALTLRPPRPSAPVPPSAPSVVLRPPVEPPAEVEVEAAPVVAPIVAPAAAPVAPPAPLPTLPPPRQVETPPAASAQAQAAPPATAPTGEEYRLGPGDKLTVSVFGHPDLSGNFEVSNEGMIAMPLAGQFRAAGRTVRDLTEDVRVALDRDFLVNPRLSIEVANYRPFYILGQVNKPGSYPYVAGLDMRQAVAIAGGFTRRAAHWKVVVTRQGKDGRADVELAPDSPVLPGDTIEVPRRLF